MKKLLFAFTLLLTINNAFAQMVDPAKWTSRIESVKNDELTLVFEATIEPEWHIYSQFTPEDGPLPLEVKIKIAKGNFELLGKATESKTSRKFNDIFGVDEIFFSNKAIVKQRIKVTNKNLKNIDAVLEYQICKEVCINDKKSFSFKVPVLDFSKQDNIETSKPVKLLDTISEVSITEPAQATVDTAKAQVVDSKTSPEPITEGPQNKRSLWSIFFLAFLSGFAALLTPCVFPLIPMTVSFFTKQSKNRTQGIRNAIFYGISIIVIYVTLGFAVSYIFGADALNSLATNVYFNVIFFLLLVFFATSFLGAFEIMLPNSWANKVDKQADKGGIVGILFMALALAIVSFSCTGPIVGTLLFEAASQGFVGPILGMFGFSLALALPFMLFALFPGWLNTLPKSGGWLNTVKVFLGFLELALAFKFLSNADLVLQLHIIEREVFLSIWIAIFGTLALYLFGKITLPHDSPLPSISVGRLMTGLLVLTFTVYLIPGLWGAPLKLISAFPPPPEYSESPLGVGRYNVFSGETKDIPDGGKMVQGMLVFNDYAKGIAYAKSVNKPMLVDFTGFACVNCRKMEQNVWTDSRVANILKNDVVLISLYVDDKRDLPKAEQFKSPMTGELLESVGDKWTDLMISKYRTNTQPLYIIEDLDGKAVQKSISFVGVEEYLQWLKDGLEKFRK